MVASPALPPQNIEAEESILGGILLDPEAIGRIVDLLLLDAFYVKAHRRIYEAMLSLHGQGQPTDLMSVSSWLQDHHHLEAIGGIVKLTQLADRTLSAVNIDRYASLVMDKYLRRQLIAAGHEIVELGYDTTKALEIAFDEAEQKIFRLTQSRPQSGLVPLSETLINTFSELEKLHQKLASPGVETQFYDLDAMTGGLQRADLIILAGRPSMGKTAFGLGIAASIAKHQNLPVAIFSLEMSKEQLALRLLASESMIDSNRLRTGNFSETEYEPLTTAMGTLSALPLYIDDTASISVTQIRSQVRRLQSEQKGQLGMVLIDYLQLMEGSSDNRVQELSKITRSLKGLAREINAPVVALSQLSRAVESRTNKRPMMSDLRECVTGDTSVALANGQQVPIKKLVGQQPEVVTMDKTGKIGTALAETVWEVGQRPIYRLMTAAGKVIRATQEHRLYTLDGWKKFKELRRGDRLATPRLLPEPESPLMWQSLMLTGVFETIKSVMKEQGISHREMAQRRGTAYGGSSHFQFAPSRSTLKSYASILRNQSLMELASSDIFWDTIVSIDYDGDEFVYDLTVPETASWIANGIISHNSGSIEQDADLIMMIYRDEYYNPETPDQGIAELLITKHRNGPTGVVKLLFKPEFTQFLNLQQSQDY